MKDRFKFRIWDKPTGQMFYTVCLGNIDCGIKQPWACADTPEGQISYTGDRLKDIEIMQCTGLKDKNGKLIYEGDVLKCLNSTKLGIIEWKTHMYQVKFWAWNSLHTLNMNNIEVLGNIHENPELLESE